MTPDLFREPLYFVERCEQRPRSQRVAIVGIGGEPDNAAAAALGSFESKDRFKRFSARARHIAGRSPMGIRPKTSRMGSADVCVQLSKNGVQAVDRPDVPSQG